MSLDDGVAYTTDGHLLFPFRPAVDSTETEADFDVWDSPFLADSDITTPPVLAAGLVYFGTRDGLVFAVDETTGSDVSVQGSIVVLDGAVIVTTSGGHLIAIAGEFEASAPEGEGTPGSLN